MRAEGMPVVVVARSCPELDHVCADELAGGILVGQHLVKMGHKRIAYVCGGESYNEPQQTRWQGLQRVRAEAGLDCADSFRLQVDHNGIEGGLMAAQRVLDLSPRPTAIFAATDRIAIGLIHRLKQLGVQVPGDIAVVGFDDIPTAEYCEVPLTTVSYAKYEMGRLAAQMLFERIEGKGPKIIEQVRLQPELAIRQSCGFLATKSQAEEERTSEATPKVPEH
jgi:DNA-binding LacI/PurR family transcriptional regulator